MDSLNRLGGVVDHLREGRSGSLTIGAFSSAAQFWLPAVAKGLRRDFPDLVLDLSLNELGPEPAGPARRDLDITTEDADQDGVERPGHSRHVLTEEPYRVVAPRGHALLTEWDHEVPLGALAGQPLIDNDYHGNTCTLIIRNACLGGRLLAPIRRPDGGPPHGPRLRGRGRRSDDGAHARRAGVDAGRRQPRAGQPEPAATDRRPRP